jgi:hypothetical protein
MYQKSKKNLLIRISKPEAHVAAVKNETPRWPSVSAGSSVAIWGLKHVRASGWGGAWLSRWSHYQLRNALTSDFFWQNYCCFHRGDKEGYTGHSSV